MELICEFSFYTPLLTDEKSLYKCIVTDINRIASNGRVINIIGAHINGKSNEDVQSLTIFDLDVDNFPRYLCKFFPNLKSISIIACGLKKLSKFDFIGCDEIEKLMLNGNKITTLPNDVFDYAKNLESISFFDNQIDFIGEKVFEEMKKLKYLNLKMNTAIDLCVNEYGSGRMTMEEMKKFIKLKFEGRKIGDWSFGNKKLSETLKFLENFIESSRILMEDNMIRKTRIGQNDRK